MKTLLLIGTGGFIGTILRYALSQFIRMRILTIIPLGTLAVNLLGCFAIGLVIGLSERSEFKPEWHLFLATGICGGFTTFSAFSSETFGMLREGRLGYASLYIIASVLLGVLATFSGYFLFKLS